MVYKINAFLIKVNNMINANNISIGQNKTCMSTDNVYNSLTHQI